MATEGMLTPEELQESENIARIAMENLKRFLDLLESGKDAGLNELIAKLAGNENREVSEYYRELLEGLRKYNNYLVTDGGELLFSEDEKEREKAEEDLYIIDVISNKYKEILDYEVRLSERLKVIPDGLTDKIIGA